MRGNQKGSLPEQKPFGSIPAHAGQPGWGCGGRVMDWVYPRACGATFVAIESLVGGGGLSPRMRGNHDVPFLKIEIPRSIPAHAGQPIGVT